MVPLWGGAPKKRVRAGVGRITSINVPAPKFLEFFPSLPSANGRNNIACQVPWLQTTGPALHPFGRGRFWGINKPILPPPFGLMGDAFRGRLRAYFRARNYSQIGTPVRSEKFPQI